MAGAEALVRLDPNGVSAQLLDIGSETCLPCENTGERDMLVKNQSFGKRTHEGLPMQELPQFDLQKL